jgi:phosphatidylserine/phosphatidylglycerophosphate/cardiolipin synthase-like enzyme
VLVEWMGLEQSIFEMVEEFMIIQGNYLILSETVFRELRELQERQPHSVIIYSTNSLASTGCFHCHAASRKQRERMFNHGLHIYEMRPAPGDVRHFSPRYDSLVAEDRALPEDHGEQADDFELYDEVLTLNERAGPQYAIHAKSVVIDGDLGMIGSHNFDPRSRLHNTEAAVMFYGAEPVAALERELLQMTEDPNSWTVAPEQRIPVWNEFCEVMSVTSRAMPVLDLWPLFYTADFELREGAEPVLYDDPRFYENYRDVGEFPEVPMGLKKLKTRLFGIFGGLLVSLL